MTLEELRSQEEYFGGATAIPAIPRDNFANMVLEAVVCHGELVGKCSAMNFDVQQGVGGVVQVPIIAARNAQGPFSTDCHCLTAASSTITKATVTIFAWGDYESMCEFPLWKATPYVKGAIINEMGKALAHRMDHQIWWSVCTTGVANAAGHRVSTAVSCRSTATKGSCCIYSYNLNNTIVSATAEMQSNCYNPDTILMNPTVAAWFKLSNTDLNEALLKMDSNGNITAINGLTVLQTGVAPICGQATTAAQPTMVIILDSKRALAEAWGKRPSWEEVRDPHCDSYQEVVWAYWGVNWIDRGAVFHIRNP
jgi:hypothetical protein